MKKYSNLTERYLKNHKVRSVLTAIGIVTAIAMFTVIGSIYKAGINSEIDTVKKNSGDYEVMFKNLSAKQVQLVKNNVEIKNGGCVVDAGGFEINNKKISKSLRNFDVRLFDATAINIIFNLKLLQGHLPQNEHEVIVYNRYYLILKEYGMNSEISGKFIKGGKQNTYKIVGVIDSDSSSNMLISTISNYNRTGNDYHYYANLKANKGKIEVANKVSKIVGVKYQINKELLYLYGDGPNQRTNDSMLFIFAFIMGIVMVCTVVVIYNAFNISVMEKVKHFGVLRSIGATKGQIRSLVFKEALIMSIISIPLGIAIGLAGIQIVFNWLMGGFLGAFNIGVYPDVLGVATLLGILTIFISAFFPAFTASRVSPVDAIRGTMILKGEKNKRTRAIFTKLIFGFVGQVAFKNIKRSRKRFYFTCASLVISLIMFVFFSNFVDILFESTKVAYKDLKVDGVFMQSQVEEKGLVKALESTKGISKVYKTKFINVKQPIEKSSVNPKFRQVFDAPKSKLTIKKDANKYYLENTQMISYDSNAVGLLNQVENLKINYADMVKNNEIVIVNKAESYSQDGTRFYDSFTNYKLGDKITIKGKTYTVAAVIDYEVITGNYLSNNYSVIMPDQTFDSAYGKSVKKLGYSAICFNYTSPQMRENLYQKMHVLADINSSNFMDVSEQKIQTEKIKNQMTIIIYGFITMIIIIAIVNIINTITINLLVKKREYAIFKAIGMTKGQFSKLVLLEGTLFGIVATIVGLPLSYFLVKIVVFNNPVGFLNYDMPIWPYVSGAVVIILLTLLAAYVPLGRLNKMNIVEALRIEE